MAVIGLTLLLLVACGQQEEPVVMGVEAPIYAKDGTIIGMWPTVGPGRASDMDGSMSGDDSDG